MKTIRTTRLELVPVTVANAGVLWDVLQSPDLRDFQDLPNVERASFLRTIEARPTRLRPGSFGRFEWLLQLRGGSEPLGWVSLRIGEVDRSSGEIGYSVVSLHRGRGFASEAVAGLVAEGFRAAGLRRIRAFCLPENAASRAVLRRSGFEEDGTLPRGATVQGRPVDVMGHTLERETWETEVNRSRPATQS